MYLKVKLRLIKKRGLCIFAKGWVHILTLKKCWHSRWAHPNLQKMLMTFAGRLRPSFILSGKGSQVAKGVESQSHFSSAAGKSEKVSLGERGSWDGQSGIKSVIRCQIFSALVLFRTPSWTYNNCPSVVVLYLYIFFSGAFSWRWWYPSTSLV